MQFSIKPGLKGIPRIAVAFVLALIPGIYAATRLVDALFWLGGLFLLTIITIRGKDEGKNRWAWIAMDVILPVFAAAFAIYFMQYINLVDHNKISATDSNMLYSVMYGADRIRFLYELPIIAGFYYFLRMCTVSRRFAAAFTPLPFLLVGLIDFYIYTFRGHEILASDIYSFGTAMNVAGNYEYPLWKPFIYVVLPYALYFIACLRIKNEPKLLPWYAKIAIFLVLSVGSEVAFVFMLDDWSKTNTPQGWNDKGSIYNGLLMNIALSAHSLRQKEPEGYSNTYVDEVLKELNIDPNDPGKVTDDSANVIVILSESYMQLKDYLPMMGYFQDPTPYWNSLKENTIHGYVTSSVYGGNTPNTEFEVLTSITTAYMPAGSIPYTMFLKDNTYSLPWALRNLGYTTTAMHCYDKSGWQRTRVYPLLGFEKMMFIEDFEKTDADYYRKYLSDQKAYENLVNVATSGNGQKTFTFLITMQNHGGYQDAFDNFPITEYVTRSVTGGGTFAINNYINLAMKSDEALKWLIERLSQEDEKYCVLIFGDHQPQISGFVNNMAPGKNSSWCVPYIIWTNYEMDQEMYNSQFDGNGYKYTSFNYLALDVMKVAGIEYPAYYQMVESTRDEIPCISAAGYYSNTLGKFLTSNVTESDTDANTISAIRKIQYSFIFDKNKNSFETILDNTIAGVKNNG